MRSPRTGMFTSCAACLWLLFGQFASDNFQVEQSEPRTSTRWQLQPVDTVFGLYPKATFGKYFGGEILLQEFMDQKEITVRVRDASVKFEVVYFEITVAIGDEELVKSKTEGALISEQMREIFQSLWRGDKVFFDEITYRRADGQRFKVPGLAFEII